MEEDGLKKRKMATLKVSIETLGCKTNQADSIMIEEALQGFVDIVPTEERADVYIINTCTVTEKADTDARATIRRCLSINPDAKVIITGCYAQTLNKNEDLIEGKIFSISNEKKNEVIILIKEWAGIKEISSLEKSPFSLISPQSIKKLPSTHTRPFIKIQDGCNFYCSYCIVPYVRGRQRSLNPEKVIETIKRYEDLGAREVVLTGIHLGHYGIDIDKNLNLLSLLRLIEKEKLSLRIRLSSIEPDEIDDELLDFISANLNLICPHFHIPLQSGDNEILGKMRRRYKKEKYLEIILKINEKIKDPAVGCDIIVGFPQEKEENFINTLNFVQKLLVTYFHVFSFSPREGTPAANMDGQIPEEEKKRRVALLIKIGQEKRIEFYKKFINKFSSVVVERRRDRKTGLLKGVSERYISFLFDGKDELMGKLVLVQGLELSEKKIKGKFIKVIK